MKPVERTCTQEGGAPRKKYKLTGEKSDRMNLRNSTTCELGEKKNLWRRKISQRGRRKTSGR